MAHLYFKNLNQSDPVSIRIATDVMAPRMFLVLMIDKKGALFKSTFLAQFPGMVRTGPFTSFGINA